MDKKRTNYNFDKVTKLKKIIVVASLFICLFGGIFSAIVGIDKFKNYDSPYSFGITFGIIGVLTAIYIANRIKPYVILNPIMLSKYSDLIFIFALGFIGHFMLLGFYFNNVLSKLNKCDRYEVIDKIHRESGYKRPELNILILNVNGQNHKLLCKSNYWKSVQVGQKITACDYKSKIGFDSFELPNDN